MGQCLISLIVPVYNVELYIEQCLRSLYNQDLDNSIYEIIVIDDCSEDNSVAIIEKLQKVFPSIILLKMKSNCKQGTVRNRGLEIAQGKYVWFIDSDDFIKPKVLSRLLNFIIEEDLDVLHFNYIEVFDDEEIPYVVNYDSGVISGVDFFFDERELWWEKCVEVWRRIHKRSFLIDNKFTFAEHVMYEDTDYSINMFSVPSKVRHIDFSPYYYRCNILSTTKSNISFNQIKSWILLAIRCNSLSNLLINEKKDLRFIPVIDKFIRYQLANVYENLVLLEKSDMLLYQNFLKQCDFYSLKKYISVRKYFTLKHPQFISFK